jgi:glycogen debranching enzyme
MMLWMDPRSVARGVLLFLAANQATVSTAADAEPGKILHEMRGGEMAELREVPFRRYYGSVDSTPLFVMLAGGYLRAHRRRGDPAALWPHIEAALTGSTPGRPDGDGFRRIFPRDRTAGLPTRAGRTVSTRSSMPMAAWRGPIALVEVQGYVYARIRRRRRDRRAGWATRGANSSSRPQADASAEAFEAAFWYRDRHLCAGARRRQEALPRCARPMPGICC